MKTARRRKSRPKWPSHHPGTGYRGLWINLDRRLDRRRWMEEQLEELGLADTYVRLPAIEGRDLDLPPNLRKHGAAHACFLSHRDAVRMARESDLPVNIVEDDTRLSAHLPAFVAYAAETGLLQRYDILFTELWIDFELPKIRDYDEQLRRWLESPRTGPADYVICDLSDHRLSATSSYILGPSGAKVLSGLLGNDLPREALDDFMHARVQEGRLKAGVVLPFLTVADGDIAADSDIQIIDAEYTRTYLKIREAFHVDHIDGTSTLAWFDDAIARSIRARRFDHVQLFRDFRSVLADRGKRPRAG